MTSTLQPPPVDVFCKQRYPRKSRKGHRHRNPTDESTENTDFELRLGTSCQRVMHVFGRQSLQSLYSLQLLFLIVPLLTSFQIPGCVGAPNLSHKNSPPSATIHHHLQQAEPIFLASRDSNLLDSQQHDHHVRERRSVAGLQWENATVPFVFDKLLPLRVKRQAMKAMCYWMLHTNCIRFVERTTEKYFIRFEYFENSNECFSYVGRVRFRIFYPTARPHRGQPVKLSMSCNRGKIMHELGHALGFYHEHQRPDRDQYIEIHEENILNNQKNKFEKVAEAQTNSSMYDYGSIMHYPLNAFSSNGSNTITPKFNYSKEIGQRKRLSREDKSKANNLYQCSAESAKVVLMPDNVDIIKDNNWITLTLSSLHYRLACNSNGCSLSDCGGKRFKQNDLAKCSEVLISIHKVSPEEDKIIRNGDTVSLRWEFRNELSASSYDPTFRFLTCFPNKPCTLSEECRVVDATNNCRDQEFVIKVPGNSSLSEVMHSDNVVFEWREADDNGVPLDMSLICHLHSSAGCSVSSNCSPNGFSDVVCDNSPSVFHLQKI